MVMRLYYFCQIHKRSRALRRLYRHLKDHKFRASIHMSYFVPLIYTFVTDSSFSKHANVQDAAIDLLGAVCRQLSWPHYLQMLRFYLKLLTKKVDLQRQIIRLVSLSLSLSLSHSLTLFCFLSLSLLLFHSLSPSLALS